jgi:hypothetical protein
MKIFMVLVLISMALSQPAGGENYTCNMGALTENDRARHQELSRAVLASVQEKKELSNGYAFRLPPESLVDSAQWVSFERQCCPFFSFELEIPRDGAPLWLRITGPKDVKEFIRTEFQL